MLLFFTQSDCRRLDPWYPCSNANSVFVPQDMKDRFYFKDGTYWIYININTNETDSMWVWKSSNAVSCVDSKVYGNGFSKCYESFNYRVKNLAAINGDKYYTNIGINVSPVKGTSNSELFGISDFYLKDQIESYRVDNRGGVYENQMGEIMVMMDSVVVQNNLVYRNVFRLFYPPGARTYDYLLDTYYAKNIGLVKFNRRVDSTEWELIRYHIVQ